MAVGDRVKALRTGQAMSLRSLAAAAAISVAYLVKIEKGESSPTVEVLERLAGALEVPVPEITHAVGEETQLQLPSSLREFVSRYQKSIPELNDPDWQRALVDVKLRGRYPKEADDWLPIFAAMRQTFGGNS